MSTLYEAAVTECRPVTPIGIASAILQELVAESEAGSQSNGQIFTDRLRRATEIVGGLESYVERQSSAASDCLNRLAQRTASHDWKASFHAGETSLELEQEMLSGHAEGEFLKMLVAATRPRSILEIGMFTGYGTLAMAEELADDGQIVALEYDPFVAEFAQQSFAAFGRNHAIQVIVGPAASSLELLIKKNALFDFVFIDADKTGYREYLDTLLSSTLLTDDALICVDNTLLQGEPYLASGTASENGKAIAEFNDYVSSRDDLHHVLVPIRDGVTLIRRRTVRGGSN